MALKGMLGKDLFGVQLEVRSQSNAPSPVFSVLIFYVRVTSAHLRRA